VIIDLSSRRVIGWAVSIRLKRDLPIEAMKRAIALRQPPPEVINHSYLSYISRMKYESMAR
jgi:putative transposase